MSEREGLAFARRVLVGIMRETAQAVPPPLAQMLIDSGVVTREAWSATLRENAANMAVDFLGKLVEGIAETGRPFGVDDVKQALRAVMEE